MAGGHFMMTRAGRLRLTVLAALSAALTVGGSTAIAQESASQALRELEAPDASLRNLVDRPVQSFTRSPAAMLLTPEELIRYENTRSRADRIRFIEEFWASVAANCPAGANPVRDGWFDRADAAGEEFSGAGIPGWMTDRGRVFMLLGAPDRTKEVSMPRGEEIFPLLVWEFDDALADKSVTNVVFIRERRFWHFLGANAEEQAGGSYAVDADAPGLATITASWASSFREQGCELSDAQIAEARARDWQRQLYEAAAAAETEGLDGEGDYEPIWSYFAAAEGATYAVMTIALDESVAPDSTLVASLKAKGSETSVFTLGSADFPFDVRPSGSQYVASVGRSLPPGSYSTAVGVLGADGALDVKYRGQSLIVRLPSDQLRLTSVMLAQSVTPAQEAGDASGLSIGNYVVVPRLSNVFQGGQDLNLFYQVVGVDGSTPLDVTYQVFGRPPGGDWQQLPGAAKSSNPGAERVWTLPISPAYPPVDYKVEITVVEPSTGARANQNVLFSVTR